MRRIWIVQAENKIVSIMFVNVQKRDINLMAILVSVSCQHVNIDGSKPLSEGALPSSTFRFRAILAE